MKLKLHLKLELNNDFFKDDLHINKTDYTKEIADLSRENFLLQTKREDLYILNPIMVEYIDSIEFNIF